MLLLTVLPLAPALSGGVLAQSATPVAMTEPAATPVAVPAATPEPTATPLAPGGAAPFDAAIQAELDAYAADLANRLGIVGASVAVTQGGEVVFSRGYGVRKVGGTEPVTPETRFMIGSVTKGMTGLMAATVVDDGFATWETPLVALLPGLKLDAPGLTQKVTLADSFCACTGLPRDDLPLILHPPASAAEMIADTAEIAPTAPFGETFQYSNQMYAIGGYAATAALGATTDDLVPAYELSMADRVLGPIGMTDSTFAFADVVASGNYAHPSGAALDGEVRPIPLLLEQRFVTPVTPAGGLWSTAPDMARYLATEMNGGVSPDGVRVVSQANLARTQATRALMPARTALPPVLADAFQGYAMGWVTGTWQGMPLVTHSGGTLGFASETAMLPQSRVGIALLTNGGPEAGLFNLAVQYRLFELLWGQEPDASAQIADLADTSGQQSADFAASLSPTDLTLVGDWVGTYEEPQLGTFSVATRGADLILTTDLAPSRLVPRPGGAPGEYLMADPPFAMPSLVVTLRKDAADNPEIGISLEDDSGTHDYTLARTD